MAKFNEYPAKATPEDADTLMLYDAATKSNKLSPFSGIWNWMVGKLTNAVISNLQTNNKTVLGAINELNSNALRSIDVDYGDITIGATGFADLASKMPQTGTVCMSTIQYYGSITPRKAINVYATSNASYVFGEPNTTISRLIVRYWYTK